MGEAEDQPTRSVLGELRARLPDHPITLAELLTLLDRLAAQLRVLAGVRTDKLPDTVISSMPSIHIEHSALPIAGYAFWDPSTRQWIIRLNYSETPEDQRFTLLHEFAHILWHHHGQILFANLELANRQRLAEHAADLFAGEALIPKNRIRRVYEDGLREDGALARHFGVSVRAIEWKLDQMDIRPAVTDSHIEPSIHPRSTPIVEAAA